MKSSVAHCGHVKWERVQGQCLNIEKTEKLLKQMLNDGTYWIAADEMTGG